MNNFFSILERKVLHTLEVIGDYTLFVGRCIYWMFKPPFEFSAFLYQCDYIGVQSLVIVTITALFTGMVLALQTAYQLAYFGATIYVGKIVALSLVRELGPVLSALMLSGRIGAGIAAEIGSMNVTEQVDAVRALGASPYKKLVVPKIWASLITLPLLCILADFLGIFGGALIGTLQLNIHMRFYYNTVLETLTFYDVFTGIAKTFFFAFFIATIGSYMGMKTEGGTVGVGESTTLSVVASSLAILISDLFLTQFLLTIKP